MEKHFSSLVAHALLAVALFAPLSASAYLSPDQVFGGSSLTLQSPPPTQREGDDVVEVQQQNAASSRAAAQQNLTSNQAEPVDTYVAPDSTSSRGLFDQDTQYQLRQERAASDNAGSPTIIITGDGDVIDANGTVLHSGAPLITTTGPENILAMLVLLLSGASTFGYMQYRSRMMARA